MAAMLKVFGIAYASLEEKRLFNAKTDNPKWSSEQFILIIAFSFVIVTKAFYSHQ